jgi:hypothetical protein
MDIIKIAKLKSTKQMFKNLKPMRCKVSRPQSELSLWNIEEFSGSQSRVISGVKGSFPREVQGQSEKI